MSASKTTRAPTQIDATTGPLVVQISAGTGPVEVRRFVAALADRVADRCAEMGAIVGDVVVRGDEDAPLSVELHLPAAPIEVRSLAGTHALIARSPDRGKRSRKRWFASVSVSAAPDAVAPSVSVSRDEVVITAMRSGGPGGQHVNRTASAVRVVHVASGITVRVSAERSQRDNVSAALARIARQIEERDGDRAARARASMRLQHYRITRGTPAFVYELGRDGRLAIAASGAR